jgi:hypothetical protein
MPKYRLNKPHYLQDRSRKIDPRLHEEGSVIEWAGPPSAAMQPLDKEAKEIKAEYDAKRPKPGSGRSFGGWTAAFERNYSRIIQPPPAEAETNVAASADRGRRATPAAAASERG